MVPLSPHSSVAHGCGERKWSDLVRLVIAIASIMQSAQISYYGDGINYDNASLFNQGVIFLYVRTRLFVLFTCGSPAVPVEIIPYDG